MLGRLGRDQDGIDVRDFQQRFCAVEDSRTRISIIERPIETHATKLTVRRQVAILWPTVSALTWDPLPRQGPPRCSRKQPVHPNPNQLEGDLSESVNEQVY